MHILAFCFIAIKNLPSGKAEYQCAHSDIEESLFRRQSFGVEGDVREVGSKNETRTFIQQLHVSL